MKTLISYLRCALLRFFNDCLHTDFLILIQTKSTMELFDSNLTGTKIIIPFENTENTNSSIPLEYSRVDFVGWVRIISYIIVFTISGAGNLWELNSVLRRSKIRRAPVNRLLLHLCIADIIVVLMVAGVEILWRISISWQAGEFLCKSINPSCFTVIKQSKGHLHHYISSIHSMG